MPNKREYKERIRREVSLYIQEMRDGCLDCRKVKGLCHTHYKEAIDVVLDPKRFLEDKKTK